MRQPSNESGAVLFAVLAVLLVVSLLFTSVISYGAWHRAQTRRFLHKTQAKYLALAALENARRDVDLKRVNMNGTMGAYSIGDSVAGRSSWQAEISPWGFYWRATCRGSSHNQNWTIDALLGNEPSEDFKYAIRLFGPPYPLVVAGQTRVTGDVSVGPGGVTAGRFRGRSFRDSILVHGDIDPRPVRGISHMQMKVWDLFQDQLMRHRRSNSQLIDRMVLVDDSFEFGARDSVLVVDQSITFDRTKPLRAMTARYTFSSGPILIIGDTKLDGRWTIVSDQSIEVRGRSQLQGVILKAPRITIRDEAVVSGQAIAELSLEVKDQATTVFPTLLWVTGDRGNMAEFELNLESTSACEGMAGVGGRDQSWIYPPEQRPGMLSLGERSVWKGYLYSHGRARVQGTLLGSILAELLFFDDPPTTYLNWLLDARVNRLAWEGSVALPITFPAPGKTTVAEYIPNGVH